MTKTARFGTRVSQEYIIPYGNTPLIFPSDNSTFLPHNTQANHPPPPPATTFQSDFLHNGKSTSAERCGHGKKNKIVVCAPFVFSKNWLRKFTPGSITFSRIIRSLAVRGDKSIHHQEKTMPRILEEDNMASFGHPHTGPYRTYQWQHP